MSTRVIHARSKADTAAAAARGARALRAGKLVGFATETVYGVAAAATKPKAMERLRELKSRPKRPFSVHVGRPEDVKRYVGSLPADAQRLIDRVWPGPLTLLLRTGGRLADESLQAAGMHEVLCSDETIGLRCPEGELCRAMLCGVKAPVVAPSANPAGKRSPREAKEVLAYLDGRIDLLIDTGVTKYGRDSTIVKFDADGWKIVRRGVLDARTIRRILKRTILFVCTGNTCRSPMAAGLARKILAERLGIPVARLPDKNVEVVSAGVWAADGQHATPEAVRAARNLGADIAKHRSRKLTIELINDADLIFCMTDYHVAEVRRLSDSSDRKIRRLDYEADIPDPIGGGADVYRKTAERIERAVITGLDREAL